MPREVMDEDFSVFGRRIPHDAEAEMAMLGAMLVNKKAVVTVRQFLPSSDALALADHRLIFDAITAIADAGGDPSPEAVKHHLGSTVLPGNGGSVSGYLNRLVDCAVTVINSGEYARLIADYAARREMIARAEDVLRHAYGEPAEATVAEALEALGRCQSRSTGRLLGLANYRMQDLDKINIPPKTPLLGGWLHRQSKAFVVGGPKTGKSFFTLEIARAVATGRGFLHWRGSGKPANVLYIDGEMGLLDLKRRRSFMADRSPDFGNLFIASFDRFTMPPIETEEGQAWVLSASDEVDAHMVVFDNWTTLTRVSLSDDDAVKSVIPLINALLAKLRAVLCVLHTGHDKTRYAGSSALGGLTTGIVHMTRDETSKPLTRGDIEFQLTREADPDDDDYRPFQYVIERGAHFMEDRGHRQEAAPMKREHRWAMEQLSQCLAQWGMVMPGSSVRPAGLSCVKISAFAEWMGGRMPTEGAGWAEKQIKELILAGNIAAEGDLLWQCKKG